MTPHADRAAFGDDAEGAHLHLEGVGLARTRDAHADQGVVPEVLAADDLAGGAVRGVRGQQPQLLGAEHDDAVLDLRRVAVDRGALDRQGAQGRGGDTAG